MPLKKGSSSKVIGQNIAEMIKAGHSPASSAAAAYKKAGKYHKPGKAKGGKRGRGG